MIFFVDLPPQTIQLQKSLSPPQKAKYVEDLAEAVVEEEEEEEEVLVVQENVIPRKINGFL